MAIIQRSRRCKTVFDILHLDVSITSLAAQGAEISQFFKRPLTGSALPVVISILIQSFIDILNQFVIAL